MRNASKGSFLFSDVKSRPIDPKNFRSRNWDKDFKAAGVRQIRIHDARHTYASLFMMSGDASLYDLKEVLGHASLKDTLTLAVPTLQELETLLSRILD